MTTLAATGHRPDKLGGYNPANPVRRWVREQLWTVVEHERPSRMISGLALGVDQDWAALAILAGVPLVAAVPFAGQELLWPSESRCVYRKLIAAADEIVVVSEGGYAPAKMFARNIWMVDHCDAIAAVWDGSLGGTAHCVAYADKRGRRIIRIDPRKAS